MLFLQVEVRAGLAFSSQMRSGVNLVKESSQNDGCDDFFRRDLVSLDCQSAVPNKNNKFVNLGQVCEFN
jgi:hypothetical protein